MMQFALLKCIGLVRGLMNVTYQHIKYPVSEHSPILCRCPGTSARALSVNTALRPMQTLATLLANKTQHC